LFLGDVAVRRIAPDMDRIKLAIANEWKMLRGQDVVKKSEFLDKLKTRKAEVDEQLDRSRFASRFETTAPPAPEVRPAAGPIGEPLLEGSLAPDRARVARPAAPPAGGLAPEARAAEEASYTNRLLKAKQRVWEEREKDKDKDKRDPRSGS
jgi:hypothetical protein